ncbi:MAG: LysE family translocator, partial [Pseudomonadota bacterium]
VTTLFTSFVPTGADPLWATLTVALVLFLTQLVFHPLWSMAGHQIAQHVRGKLAERVLFITLAVLTVLSVIYALTLGANP